MKGWTRPTLLATDLQRIVSGGQTGVDRGALDAAIALGLPHGGWCPSGRRAEGGTIPDRYQLEETPSADYAVRTRLNVRESDATLILSAGDPTGGTALTVRLAKKEGRPHLVLDLLADPDPEVARSWIQATGVRVLNVAGPRESKCPGIAAQATAFLLAALA